MHIFKVAKKYRDTTTISHLVAPTAEASYTRSFNLEGLEAKAMRGRGKGKPRKSC